MIKYNLRSLFLILLVSVFLKSPEVRAMNLDNVLDLGLKVLVIETENREEPSCEYVSAPAGSMGKSITNATKIPGSLKIFSPQGDLLFYSGEYEKNESGMTIKIRGNTSAYATKKPYKIKLQKKEDLLLRGDKKFNDKNWVLLNDNHLKLYTGFTISRLIEKKWTPDGEYVNVIINDVYKGLYYLVESIERNEKSRVDVSETGFILEHDAYWWNEDNQYILSEFNPLLNYTFKYPDFTDLDSTSLNEIQDIINGYENSLKDDTYPNYIDLVSFAKFILGHDILGTWDGGGSNLYILKYDNTANSLIEAGPLWDFDTIEINEGKWSGIHSAFNRFDYLFESEDSEFFRVYKRIWEEKGKEIYEGIISLIRNYRNEEIWKGYKLSSVATSKFWGGVNDPKDAADRDEAWFLDRFKWLKEQLGDFKNNDDAGIDYASNIENNKLIDVYNLQGILILKGVSKKDLNNLKKGIYIIDHKKVIIK